jgi:AcrR family transcriptional regulator
LARKSTDPTDPTGESALDARAARSRARALIAARAILVEEGVLGLSHQRVAEVSGLHRATIYRHWPTTIALLLDVTAQETAAAMPRPTGDLRADLLAALLALRDELVDGFGRFLATLLDRAEFDDELHAAKLEIAANGLASVRVSIDDAIARGDLHQSVEVDVGVAQLFGPILYRRFLSANPISDTFIIEIVDSFLAIHAADLTS